MGAGLSQDSGAVVGEELERKPWVWLKVSRRCETISMRTVPGESQKGTATSALGDEVWDVSWATSLLAQLTVLSLRKHSSSFSF